MIRNQSLVDRFLRYVVIDTQSSEDTGTTPSTEKQRDLALLLIEELSALGAEVDYDEPHCIVYGFLPGNPDPSAGEGNGGKPGAASPGSIESAKSCASPDGTAAASPAALGFLAHLDTSPAVTGKNIAPRIIENYDGNDPILKTEEFPDLLDHIGEDLIATDGTTLLGADDKAGIAEIMEMLAYFVSHPEVPHRPIAVCFTPDEEIGEGPKYFDPARFRAKEAYTIDGGKLGELEYECFNAALATVTIEGKNVHPGTAKDQMINACTIAADYIRALPKDEVPEKTEGHEGFYHLDTMQGSVEGVTLKYILRDFTREGLDIKKKTIQDIADTLNETLDRPRVTVTIKDQYRNMLEVLKDHPALIENAKTAMEKAGVTPIPQPIRGGTDGAALCFMGIPCPNLCTGGYQFHSRFEYASIQEMETIVTILITLAS